jgi:hypothetical protein
VTVRVTPQDEITAIAATSMSWSDLLRRHVREHLVITLGLSVALLAVLILLTQSIVQIAGAAHL